MAKECLFGTRLNKNAAKKKNVRIARGEVVCEENASLKLCLL